MNYEALRRIKKKKEKWFRHTEPKSELHAPEFFTLLKNIEPRRIFSEEEVEKIWNQLYPTVPIPCKIFILGYENEDYLKLRESAREKDSLKEQATLKEHGRLIDIEESSACNFFIPKMNTHFIIYRLDSSKTLSEQITHELHHVYDFHILHVIG